MVIFTLQPFVHWSLVINLFHVKAHCLSHGLPAELVFFFGRVEQLVAVETSDVCFLYWPTKFSQSFSIVAQQSDLQAQKPGTTTNFQNQKQLYKVPKMVVFNFLCCLVRMSARSELHSSQKRNQLHIAAWHLLVLQAKPNAQHAKTGTAHTRITKHHVWVPALMASAAWAAPTDVCHRCLSSSPYWQLVIGKL